MTNIELSKQLRIGNYVQSKPLSIPRLQISSDGIMTVSGYGISVLESDTNNNMDINPIQLNEEWFLKFGFKNKKKYDWQSPLYSNGNFNIISCSGKFFKAEYTLEPFASEQDWNILDDAIEISTVHQLQNLYYVLTGEELTIKD